jgi:hypothetical protein
MGDEEQADGGNQHEDQSCEPPLSHVPQAPGLPPLLQKGDEDGGREDTVDPVVAQRVADSEKAGYAGENLGQT